MISSAVLLPFVALVLNDVEVNRVDNVVNVNLVTSEPIAVEKVRGMTGPQRMYVFLNDTTPAQKTYSSVRGPIVAHTRARYTKLEIPTGREGRCFEPVKVEATATGIRLRALCNEAVEPKALAGFLAMEKNAQLRAALVPPVDEILLDRNKVSAREIEKPGQAIERTIEGKKAAAAAIASIPTSVPSGSLDFPSEKAKVTLPVDTTAPLVPVATSGILTSEKNKPEGNFSMILAVGLLAGLGVAAFLLARRRAAGGRMIHILETASIGAKRSLVVATIGGRTMVLGVSEAGVTLLDSSCAAPNEETHSTPVEPEEASFADDLPVGRLTELRKKLLSAITGKKDELLDDPQTSDPTPEEPLGKSEGGVLGRLFSRTGVPKVDPEPLFQDVLDDSYEDQELRQKLASGMGGRVA